VSRALARAFACLAFLVFLPAATPACAQAPPRADVPRAITAVHLATLAERIAKLHAQIGQGILVERSRRALDESSREFEADLRSLSTRAPTAELRDNFVLLGLLWPEYRAWALRPATRDSARRLGERAEEVVWVAMKGARMLQATTRSATEVLAIKAAEAATLSQRIPRLYLWRRWGIRDEGLQSELGLAEAQLHGTLDSLRSIASDTPEIAAELLVAQNQAAFLAQASKQLEGGRDVARHLEFVAKTGDHILESMERIARAYDAKE
jgi:hypothetical protein